MTGRPLLLFALLAACEDAGTTPHDDAPSGDDTDPTRVDTDGPTSDDSDPPVETDADTDLPVADPCAAGALAPGDYQYNLDHDGRRRRYKLHVPPSHDGATPQPLMLNLHGWLETPERQMQRSRMAPDADAHGFVLAYPAGIDSSWNGGACCGTAVSEGLDDVGFLRAVVAEISARVCVDAQRVYVTGFSNGGFMAHRLACQASDLFAAAAPVSSMMTIDRATCDTDHVAPLIHIHGTLDPIVPYIGNPLFDYPTFDDSVARWTDFHGCAGAPTHDALSERVSCDTWAACEDGAEIRACTIENWLHEWPGQSAPLDANEEIWAFVSRFTLGAPE